MDALNWKPGWVPTPKDEWDDIIKNFIDKQEWIIDGNYGRKLDIRLESADKIIFLNMPMMVQMIVFLKYNTDYLYYRKDGVAMIQDSSTICWNKAGKELCDIAQKNDFRMYFIMPYTLQQLGDVSDKKILDLGCGEGGYSRALAHKGANVTSIDCAIDAINYAIEKANEEGLKIKHFVRNSNDLYDIGDGIFDIVLCAMMLMDCEDLFGTVKEISRVLKPGGKLFVSVLHPCFNGKNIRWTGGDDETKVVVENYFSPKEWKKQIVGISSPIIFRHRTLQEYVKVFTQNGLRIVDMNEPLPTNEQIVKSSRIGQLLKIPMFLFMELKK